MPSRLFMFLLACATIAGANEMWDAMIIWFFLAMLTVIKVEVVS